jgi:hypothetical protein
MPQPMLYAFDGLPGVAVELPDRRSELDDEVAGEVLWLDFADEVAAVFGASPHVRFHGFLHHQK